MNDAISNPHMWIPNVEPDEEYFGELCRLCGTFRGDPRHQPDPPGASLPCPEAWPPELPHFDKGETDERLVVCRECGEINSPGMWDFAGKFCPECGSNKGALKATAQDRLTLVRRLKEARR